MKRTSELYVNMYTLYMAFKSFCITVTDNRELKMSFVSYLVSVQMR